MTRIFHTWILPLVWLVSAITSYFHPGDEYGWFVLGALPGVWVCFLMENVGHLRDVLWIILLAGIVVLAGVGFLMDRIRVSRRWWAALYVIGVITVAVLSIRSFPSLDRALAKNGSIAAYVAGASGVAVYLSALLMIVHRGIARIFDRARTRL